MFMNIRNCYPRYLEYQILFPHSPRLQSALCNFYAVVVRFCKRMLESVQSKGTVVYPPYNSRTINSLLAVGVGQLTQVLWKPFEVDFGKFRDDLQRQNEDVKEEIKLAAEKAAYQERQLQMSHRSVGSLFRRKMEVESDEARNWRLQANERKLST
jgi:CHASE1-domain containing sensor protein